MATIAPGKRNATAKIASDTPRMTRTFQLVESLFPENGEGIEVGTVEFVMRRVREII